MGGGLTRVVHDELSAAGPHTEISLPIMRSYCRGSFDRVADVTTAFEFYNIPYAVWGTMLNYIHPLASW